MIYPLTGKLSRLIYTVFPAALLMALSSLTQAQDFCARAQQWIAETELQADVISYDDHEAFVESKATISPLTVAQHLSNPEETKGIATVVSCKMKTAEMINEVYGADSPVAGHSQSCTAVLARVVEESLSSLAGQSPALPREAIVIDEEESTFIGPMWLKPWPFVPVSLDQNGKLHLHSKALYVPDAWYIPMPDSFKGVYYCHLIAPDYLQGLLSGSLPMPQ